MLSFPVKPAALSLLKGCPSESESRPVVSDSLWPLNHTVHGILQARMLEWVAFPFSRGPSQPRAWTLVSHIAGGFFTNWDIRNAQEYWSGYPIPSPADLPDPGIKLGSPALQAFSLPTELLGKPFNYAGNCKIIFQNGGNFVHSHQKWMRSPITPYHFSIWYCQFFMISVILVSMS